MTYVAKDFLVALFERISRQIDEDKIREGTVTFRPTNHMIPAERKAAMQGKYYFHLDMLTVDGRRVSMGEDE